MATFPSDSVRTKNWGTEILTDSDLEGQLDLIHDYIKAALNSSTGHNHDGTSNQSKKLAYSALESDFVNDFTTVTGASGDYLLLSDVSDSNNTKKALASDFIYVPSATNALSGSVIQTVTAPVLTSSTTTTTITADDSIPQNTEGSQFLTATITPSNASNILEIVCLAWISHSANNGRSFTGLFQDSTADAIAAGSIGGNPSGADDINPAVLIHKMVAGTTSATTFNFRAGPATAGTITLNGKGGSRLLGGVMESIIIIREIKA